MEKQTLTVAEAAKLLGIGRATAYAAVRSGELPAIILRKRTLIPRAAIARLLGEEATASAEVVPGKNLNGEA